jgi:hypothetical protein
MDPDLKLRRKWTLRAHGHQMVFVKKPFESDMHVLTKAFIWALFLPAYPNLSVEIPVMGRYKPDVVQFDDNGEPIFWAEAGQVGCGLFLPMRCPRFPLKRADDLSCDPTPIKGTGLGPDFLAGNITD